MFLKSCLLIASAIVLGSASLAMAQYDAENMMNYQRTGPVLSSAGSNYDGRFDEENMMNYGPKDYSAFAQARAAATQTPSAGSNYDGRFDEENMINYGPRH